MRRLSIAVAVMMFIAVGHASNNTFHGYYSGSELLEWCESDSVANQNACKAYIGGFIDTTAAYQGGRLMKPAICIPRGALTTQLEKVAIKGLNEKPEQLHLTASTLVFNIFYEAFPCD